MKCDGCHANTPVARVRVTWGLLEDAPPLTGVSAMIMESERDSAHLLCQPCMNRFVQAGIEAQQDAALATITADLPEPSDNLN